MEIKIRNISRDQMEVDPIPVYKTTYTRSIILSFAHPNNSSTTIENVRSGIQINTFPALLKVVVNRMYII
jgi:hypothetical protein